MRCPYKSFQARNLYVSLGPILVMLILSLAVKAQAIDKSALVKTSGAILQAETTSPSCEPFQVQPSTA